jgi:hypothetical protein
MEKPGNNFSSGKRTIIDSGPNTNYLARGMHGWLVQRQLKVITSQGEEALSFLNGKMSTGF